MAGILPWAPETKVFCLFSSEKFPTGRWPTPIDETGAD
jgi:hypothetical protein